MQTQPSSIQGPGCVVGAARTILDQCTSLIDAVPDTVYTAEAQTIRGGTVGKHVRHTLDHFAAIVRSLGDGSVVDYDHRERGVPQETSRKAALDQVAFLREAIARLGETDLGRTVRIRIMLSGKGDQTELSSTVARELAFATHHAIHHHAMLKTIASEFGILTDSDFGKAPSTVNYERSYPPKSEQAESARQGR